MNDIATTEKLTAKDFTSDQEVRWCPGCGDYAIVKGRTRFTRSNGCGTRKDRFCLGYRLRGTVPLLPLDIWLPHNSWPCDNDRHRREAGQSRTRCLGRFRRR